MTTYRPLLFWAAPSPLAPVWPGDTLRSESEVIGLKQNSNGKTGVVYVRTTGTNQNGETVMEYCRWVMVRKNDVDAPAPEPVVPDLKALSHIINDELLPQEAVHHVRSSIAMETLKDDNLLPLK